MKAVSGGTPAVARIRSAAALCKRRPAAIVARAAWDARIMRVPEWLKSTITVLIGVAASFVFAWAAIYIVIELAELLE